MHCADRTGNGNHIITKNVGIGHEQAEFYKFLLLRFIEIMIYYYLYLKIFMVY